MNNILKSMLDDVDKKIIEERERHLTIDEKKLLRATVKLNEHNILNGLLNDVKKKISEEKRLFTKEIQKLKLKTNVKKNVFDFDTADFIGLDAFEDVIDSRSNHKKHLKTLKDDIKERLNEVDVDEEVEVNIEEHTVLPNPSIDAVA